MMSPILLLAAVAAAQGGGSRAARPAPPPPAATAPAPQSDWPPVSRFSDDDYPAGAMRGDEEGTTRYRIEIGPDGRVSRCTITGSSGSSALDQTTCRIVRARTRFAPARDSRGRPVTDRREGEVTWRMDEE